MRLRALQIQNFGCIDETGYELDIDKIVVLIGQNNVGKSSILDAYEAFASSGSGVALRNFRNEDPSNKVTISAVFVDLKQADLDVVGEKWKHSDTKYGECIRVRWEWKAPDQKGEKFSYDPIKTSWVSGGMGGWDTLIASRIPFPLRVRPTDDAATTENQIVDILTSAAKAALKADEGKAAEVLESLRRLNAQLAQEVETQLNDATRRVGARLATVFPGYDIEFVPAIGKIEPEKVVGAGSCIKVKGPNEKFVPLAQHGAGLRRTFLWSALGALADLGRIKQGKTPLAADRPRILLIEEPESFLHPPMVRAARESLYALAELDEWQVVATTHSPIFIDVSKSHTTIVRVARDGGQRTRLFSTDTAQFTPEELENLRMIRSCHPTVAEFFFADNVWLVEGETEQAVMTILLERSAKPGARRTTVVDCLGKGNIPLFQKILNQFGTAYTVIHDSDSPRAQRKGKWQRNAMWTINERIVQAAAGRRQGDPPVSLVAHVPDFEQFHLGARATTGKPAAALEVLLDKSFETEEKFASLRVLADQLLDGTHPGGYADANALKEAVVQWRDKSKPVPPEQWSFEVEGEALAVT